MILSPFWLLNWSRRGLCTAQVFLFHSNSLTCGKKVVLLRFELFVVYSIMHLVEQGRGISLFCFALLHQIEAGSLQQISRNAARLVEATFAKLRLLHWCRLALFWAPSRRHWWFVSSHRLRHKRTQQVRLGWRVTTYLHVFIRHPNVLLEVRWHGKIELHQVRLLWQLLDQSLLHLWRPYRQAQCCRLLCDLLTFWWIFH